MKSLAYLFVTQTKNRFKQLLKNPSQLVVLLVFAALLVFTVIGAVAGDAASVSELRGISEFSSIILAIYIFIFLLTCFKGFSSGASFYSMADANMLFPAPFSSRKVLFYGLIRQAGTSLLMGFFLLFQYSWMHSVYGATGIDLLAIILGYCAVFFSGQLTAMVIYAFTSGNDFLRNMIKRALMLLCILSVIYIAMPLLDRPENMIEPLVSRANSTLMEFFPVAGWIKSAVGGVLTGQLYSVIPGAAAVALYVVLLIVMLTFSRVDFYEDVLKATEVSFTAITAKKEGKITEALPAHVKVGKTGIGRGHGSEVFLHKHLLEDRRSRIFFLDATSLIFCAISIAFGLFMKDAGSIIGAFSFATYMQIFSVATGRWVRELLLPYVYMIPEPPFRKLLMLCRENVVKMVIEAGVIFIPLGIIYGLDPLTMLTCILARIGFGLLFMAANIFMERVLGTIASKLVSMFLYILFVLLMAVPGIVAAILASAITGLTFLAFLSMFILNAAVASLVVFFCRDMLDYADLNNR